MIYTIYDASTGQISHTVNSDDEELLRLNLGDSTYIAGSYSGAEFYVDNGAAVRMPDVPDIAKRYNFDYTQKAWVIDIDRSSSHARKSRNQLLAQVDRVNPVWYASLTAEQQTELAHYRQALLDVPQQESFPSNISWPTKPIWL
jgi:hypothetical protein